MKKFLLIVFSFVFISGLSAQNDELETISGFWSLFKNSLEDNDYGTVSSLCRFPLLQYYYDNLNGECTDVKEYFSCWEEDNACFKKQIKKIDLPKTKEFFDNKDKNDFYKRFKVDYGSEVYEFEIELWHYSYAWVYIVKIGDRFYLIGDDSVEAEEG